MVNVHRSRPGLRLAALAMAGALLAVAPARGSVVRVLALPELVDRAAAIAVVSVESSASFWRDDRIVTDAVLLVEDGLWGATAGDHLTVRTLGGEVGDLGQRVFGEPWLAEPRPLDAVLDELRDAVRRSGR